MKHLKLFQADAEYQSFVPNVKTPNVSFVEDDNKVYYNPLTPEPNGPIYLEAYTQEEYYNSENFSGVNYSELHSKLLTIESFVWETYGQYYTIRYNLETGVVDISYYIENEEGFAEDYEVEINITDIDPSLVDYLSNVYIKLSTETEYHKVKEIYFAGGEINRPYFVSEEGQTFFMEFDSVLVFYN